MTPRLFTPLRLRGLELRNRVWLAPMCQYSAEAGVVGDWHLIHLGFQATGGYGLLLAEATAVVPEGRITPQCPGLWTEEQVAAWARVVDAVHALGTPIGVQLAHAGRKASTYRPWAAGRGSVPPEDGGWTTRSPSPVPHIGLAEPTALDEAGIAEVVAAFGAAAERADRAGFDTVEVHAAHGYLLHQFLSPLSNHRTDGYGGDLAGRARIVLEVVAEVRAAFPADKPVLIRFSASDWTEGGLDVEEVAVVAGWVRELGVDLVDVSSGGLIDTRIPVGPGYQVPFARRIREVAGAPIAAVGLITDAKQAEEILAEESADVVLLGRAALREPLWPLRAASELGLPAALDGPAPWAPQYVRGAL